MAANDSDFEVVVGYKLLLSIFFLMVFLFGLFFSFGYSVGYDRGGADRQDAVATVQPMEQSGDSVRLPDALLKDVPDVPAQPAAVPGAQATAGEEEPAGQAASSTDPASAGTGGAREPDAATSSEKPRPFRESQPPKAAPPRRASSSGTAGAAAVARSIHLQVAALRVRSDAEMLAGKLKLKGYRATVFEQGSDEWHRVLVGPFSSPDAAKKDQRKLKADGLDSILRKP